MHINWLSRLKNKTFWMTFVPAFLLFVQAILKVFNIEWSFEILEMNLMSVINAVFVLLAILGIVIDPTTSGVSD